MIDPRLEEVNIRVIDEVFSSEYVLQSSSSQEEAE